MTDRSANSVPRRSPAVTVLAVVLVAGFVSLGVYAVGGYWKVHKVVLVNSSAIPVTELSIRLLREAKLIARLDPGRAALIEFREGSEAPYEVGFLVEGEHVTRTCGYSECSYFSESMTVCPLLVVIRDKGVLECEVLSLID